MASILRNEGYATAAIGKWHLGLGWQWNDGSTIDVFESGAELGAVDKLAQQELGSNVDYTRPFVGGPCDLGFDRFFGISGSLDMPPYCFVDQDRTVGIPDQEKEIYYPSQTPGLQVPGWRDDEVDVRFAHEAAAWIRENANSVDDQPFFLYCATAGPHRPCVPPAFVQGRTQAGLRGDSVALVDWVVGQILDALDETGAADDTLVIITSDNGAPTIYAEDGVDILAHSPNGDWRGQKADIWDGGHRIPFVARWPDRIPPGLVVSDLVCLTDVCASVASSAGAPIPEGAAEDSIDVLPVLTGESVVPDQRSIVHHSMGGSFAVRRGRWKAIFTTGSGGGFTNHPGRPCDADQVEGQLYDMNADPAETRNLWNVKRNLVADLYEDLKEICVDPSNGLSFDVPLLESEPRGWTGGARSARRT